MVKTKLGTNLKKQKNKKILSFFYKSKYFHCAIGELNKNQQILAPKITAIVFEKIGKFLGTHKYVHLSYLYNYFDIIVAIW